MADKHGIPSSSREEAESLLSTIEEKMKSDLQKTDKFNLPNEANTAGHNLKISIDRTGLMQYYIDGVNPVTRDAFVNQLRQVSQEGLKFIKESLNDNILRAIAESKNNETGAVIVELYNGDLSKEEAQKFYKQIEKEDKEKAREKVKVLEKDSKEIDQTLDEKLNVQEQLVQEELVNSNEIQEQEDISK